MKSKAVKMVGKHFAALKKKKKSNGENERIFPRKTKESF